MVHCNTVPGSSNSLIYKNQWHSGLKLEEANKKVSDKLKMILFCHDIVSVGKLIEYQFEYNDSN